MHSFVFWNLKKHRLTSMVADLAFEQSADLVMLAECDQADDEIVNGLNSRGTRTYRTVDPLSTKVRIYSGFAPGIARPNTVSNCGRFTIVRLVFQKTDLLMVIAHLVSKVNYDSDDQLQAAGLVREQIAIAEKRFRHQRTIVVGDLNMDPFEPGVVAARGLHAVMCKVIAREKKRTVLSDEYPFFYNPMWGLLGDATPGPPGTIHVRGSSFCEFFWHTFDQVLVRPDLIQRFAGVQVTTSIAGKSLLNSRGLPDQNVSDHLPITFQLNE